MGPVKPNHQMVEGQAQMSGPPAHLKFNYIDVCTGFQVNYIGRSCRGRVELFHLFQIATGITNGPFQDMSALGVKSLFGGDADILGDRENEVPRLVHNRRSLHHTVHRGLFLRPKVVDRRLRHFQIQQLMPKHVIKHSCQVLVDLRSGQGVIEVLGVGQNGSKTIPRFLDGGLEGVGR
jgi:hypothetical protein